MSSLLKRIEKSLRIPLYKVATLFVSKKEATLPLDGNRMKRILLIRDDRVGDMVVTLPTIQFLKDTFPHLKIDVLCSSSNIAILQENPHIHYAYILPKNKIRRLTFLRSLRKNDYDCIIPLVFLKKSRYGFFSQLIQTKNTITVVFEPNNKPIYTPIFSILAFVNFGSYTMNEILLRWICLLFGIPFNPKYTTIPFHIPNLSSEKVQEFIVKNQIQKPILIYNISASENIRQLSEQAHIEVIEGLVRLMPQFHIVVVYIHKDCETIEKLKSLYNDKISIFEPTTVIFDTIALIERSAFVISPNTAITHITATLDKPLLSIQSYHTTFEWRPKHSQYRIVSPKESFEVASISSEMILTEFSQLTQEFLQT